MSCIQAVQDYLVNDLLSLRLPDFNRKVGVPPHRKFGMGDYRSILGPVCQQKAHPDGPEISSAESERVFLPEDRIISSLFGHPPLLEIEAGAR